AGRHVDDAALFVERHAGPVVGASADGPSVLGPRLVAGLARIRDGMEDPDQAAGACVVRPHVSGRRRQTLADAAADDDEILVDDARRRQSDRLLLRRTAEILPQVDASFTAEGWVGPSRADVEGVQE